MELDFNFPQTSGFKCMKCKGWTPTVKFVDKAEKRAPFTANRIGVCDTCYAKRPTYLWKGFDEELGEYIEVEKTIKLGMGATRHVGSDSYPYHVSRVGDSGNTVFVRSAEAKPAPGHDPFGVQKYTITRDPKAPEDAVRKRKNGRWYDSGGMLFTFGNARYYQDPSF